MRSIKKENSGAALSLAVWTVSHFCVDFGCFFILFDIFSPRADAVTAGIGFLLYDTLAFGLQPVAGWLADVRPCRYMGAAGCAAVAAGLALRGAPWAALVVCALGNACFHAAGGRDALTQAQGKLARSGVFVSGGALGVSCGTLAAGRISGMAVAAAALLFALLLGVFCQPYRRETPTDARVSSGLPLAPCILLSCVAVAVRAYGGTLFAVPSAALLVPAAIPISACACAGKAAGGLFADRFGARRTAFWALVLSLPLLCFPQSFALFCAGVLLFNIPMAVTLGVLAARLPQFPGLAFGLSTLALLCGTAPSFFVPASSVRAALRSCCCRQRYVL